MVFEKRISILIDFPLVIILWLWVSLERKRLRKNRGEEKVVQMY